MKYYFLILLSIFFSISSFSQELTLLTYNIRLDIDSDGENAWVNRKEFLVSQIQFYNPDIFGIQEGLPHQVNFIKKQLNNYEFIGEGREGGNNGEYSAIFYNYIKYNILKQGTFWLSETPNKVSKSWNAAFPRICTYGLFEDKNKGTQFWVFNTHFDHISEKARIESAKLILQKIEELNTNKLAVFLLGDLNAIPNSEPILLLNKEMYDCEEISNEKLIGPLGTFNAFQYNDIPTTRIDYIFISKNESIQVINYGVLNNSFNLKYPSDHFPVFVKLNIKP